MSRSPSMLFAACLTLAWANPCLATFILDFTAGGNAALAAGPYGSPQTLSGVGLGGGITVDVEIAAVGGNIHFQSNNGLGVEGPPPDANLANQLGTDANGAETLTISLSNFQNVTASGFRFTSLQTGAVVPLDNTINLNTGELLSITTSESSSFQIDGSNSSLTHAITTMPIVPIGGSYTFQLIDTSGVDSLRISRLTGAIVPEPSVLALLTFAFLGMARGRRLRARDDR